MATCIFFVQVHYILISIYNYHIVVFCIIPFQILFKFVGGSFIFQLLNFKLSPTHLWILEGEPKVAVSKLRTFEYEEMDADPAVQQQRSLLWPALGSWCARSHLLTELLVEELLTPFQTLFCWLKAPPSQQMCGSAASKVCARGGIPSATAERAESSLI